MSQDPRTDTSVEAERTSPPVEPNDDSGRSYLMWLVVVNGFVLVGLVVTYLLLTMSWKDDAHQQLNALKEERLPEGTSSVAEAYRHRHPDRTDYSDWSLPEDLEQTWNEIVKANDLYGSAVGTITHRSASPETRRKQAKNVLKRLASHKAALQDSLEEQRQPAVYTFDDTLFIEPKLLERKLEIDILSGYAKALIDGGQPAQAVPVIRTLFRRGRVMCREPPLTAVLVGFTYMNRAILLLELLLSRPELPERTPVVFEPVQLKSLKSDFEFSVVARAINMTNTVMTQLEEADSYGTFDDGGVSGSFPMGYMWLPIANLVQSYRQVIEDIEQPYRRVHRRMKRRSAELRDASWFGRLTHMYSVIALSDFHSTYEVYPATTAKLRLARLAVRATLHAQRTNGELVPMPGMESSTDPFTGEPYHVKETEEHVILYSTGPNMEDNGGKLRHLTEDDAEYKDVGIRIDKER